MSCVQILGAGAAGTAAVLATPGTPNARINTGNVIGNNGNTQVGNGNSQVGPCIGLQSRPAALNVTYKGVLC